MERSTTNPVLKRLDAFAGDWEFEASVEGKTMARGRASFDWLEDGAFLIWHADGELVEDASPDWQANSPFPIVAIIGLDDSSENFSMLYSDARGVFRVNQMSLSDGVWKIWRAAPGFHQRFSGTFGGDGKTITGAWEGSRDGETWAHDFDLTYTKVG